MSNLPFLTKSVLEKCIKENKKIGAWLPVFDEFLPQYDINTPQRVAGFLSQTAYECSYYQRFIENLNYSEDGLLVVFKKYFPNRLKAHLYARHPEQIANRVYANRMGNGNEASGDGWRYRGRGAIMITGKDNYAACSKFLFNDEKVLLNDPDILGHTNGIVQSAIWYWMTHDLNKYADSENVLMMTKLINGGTHGLSDRKKLFDRMLKELQNG